ncbi:50S ribosomal protein L32 [Candidatus Daviesbacteria bacterium RIFCSPLOWO2_01_FULL_39_12]|uniref:Large ribosomal subunit protein bL32 n=1 Tax=Candidatus Daviesbacteria bacterium RIFCSPLOWO2_01_FULL_39_12 TaxID=1797785 RepID=A0A1F5KM20_9BACT|nr:MAG: 50S ribosomal protein L32 [Candidatus Daviesbacteria bacterium RIFCSPHIGHO2_02_FULL_39_8]OGE41973.1 MAG: 50S ribosomal protein L32 [Candidatus Daviesbacteria bacterium RIFCSPLOWO2_01_FULL_39_12]
MAGEPKRRHSKARKRVRRAAIKQALPPLVTCKNCGKLTLPHIVCGNCGFYQGKAVSKERVKVTKA